MHGDVPELRVAPVLRDRALAVPVVLAFQLWHSSKLHAVSIPVSFCDSVFKRVAWHLCGLAPLVNLFAALPHLPEAWREILARDLVAWREI